MEQIINYVKPELVVLTAVLYFIGCAFKKAEWVKDKHIPMLLGGAGIFLCTIWVFATSHVTTTQDVAMAIFTAIVQGVLVAGLSNYIDQLIKQAKKAE